MSPALSQLGEKRLLRRLSKYLAATPPAVRVFSEDCAVLDYGGKSFHLITVDSLVEGTHFTSGVVPDYYLGKKALKVNISDILSMGGTPQNYMISLGAPPQTPTASIDEIYRGMKKVAEEFKMQLVGGNVASSPVLFLDVFATGIVSRKSVVYRNGAKPGDLIFVTGALGGSAYGLNLLQQGYRLQHRRRVIPTSGARAVRYARNAILSHVDPPVTDRWTARLSPSHGITAMIDISDGLAADLAEICGESRVGAEIHQNRIPLFQPRHREEQALQLALYGGEDYHLLFTVSPGKKNARALFNSELHEIGTVVDAAKGIVLITKEGTRMPLGSGFQHFSK